MARICEVEDCERPHFGQGLCNLHYHRQVRRPKKDVRIATCSWCHERKPISEMRHPNSSRGKTPSTCHECREAHPNEGWCDFHDQSHPRSEFRTAPNRPIGIANECRNAAVVKASRGRGHDPIECASCREVKESHNYRGGRAKCPNCRDCEAAHPDEHWCRDCAEWLPKSMFTAAGRDGKYLTVRCRPCRTANAHGVTVNQILARQGASQPECAACGSADFLKVDHDHRCCPTSSGCEKCVRGYLCHECNTAEGLLRTSERVNLLADYMRRHSL